MIYNFIKEFANVTLTDFPNLQTIFLYRLESYVGWEEAFGKDEVNITYLFSNPDLLEIVYPKLIPIFNMIEEKYLSGYFNSESNVEKLWFYFNNEGDYF